MIKCWNCQSATVQTGYFEFEETQTVEEFVFLEDDGYTRLVDQTYTQRTLVFRCPTCGGHYLTDRAGIGLAELPRDKQPEQLRDNGRFHRIAPEPEGYEK